jgi:hypothetical protein
MLFQVVCGACARPIAFDPRQQVLELRVYYDKGGRVVDYFVACPLCQTRQWARFGGEREAG